MNVLEMERGDHDPNTSLPPNENTVAWFRLAVHIIECAHEDYQKYQHVPHCKEFCTAVEFFQSAWYMKLYDLCSLFGIIDGYMELLAPPKELR